MRRSTSFVAITSLCLTLVGPGILCAKDKKQAQAEALLRRARELSDIRCEGCPPFQLSARIRLTDFGGQTVEGTYKHFWARAERWRTEIHAPRYSETSGRRQDRIWVESRMEYSPLRIYQLGLAMGFSWRTNPMPWETVDTAEDRTWQCQEVKCVNLVSRSGTQRELCFEPRSGLLLFEQEPDVRIEFSEYVAAGSKFHPRSVRAFQGAEPVVDVEVDELIFRQEFDPLLFEPSARANIMPVCRGRIEEPRALEYSMPQYPPGTERTAFGSIVRLYAVTGKDGRLHNLEIWQSGGPALDQAAIKAARGWRFRPARCGGKSLESTTIHTVRFRMY